MSQIHALNYPRHGRLRLQSLQHYGFTRADTVVEIGISEAAPALLHYALAFMPTDDTFCLAAIQGLRPGQNLMLKPDGTWHHPYIPAAYRNYPFQIGVTESGENVLCVNEDSGLLLESDYGELLFNEDGQPSDMLRTTFTRIGKQRQDRETARRAAAALNQYGLLEPWPLKYELDGQERSVVGMLRVNEARLRELDAAALLELRNAGALHAAFAQLFSLQNIHKLGQLLAQHGEQQTAAERTPPHGNVFERNELISFENL
jgi:hypothetical protein